MNYTVKSNILGFDNLESMTFSKIDDLFSSIKSDDISFTLINPYLLREYSFDLSIAIKTLLQIEEDSEILVYNIAIIQNPLDESKINFLAPLVFNQSNKTMAQVVLNASDNPSFGIAEPLKNYRPKDKVA